MAVAYHRGRLIPILKERHPELQGRMMAVGGTKEEVAPLIDTLKEKEVRIACFNSPSSLTISGDEPALAELEKLAEEKQMFNRRLMVDVAYHSHHMNLVAKEYRASIAKLEAPGKTNVKFHSSLYGRRIEGAELQPSYWVDNLTCPVRFSEALESMLEPDGEHAMGVNMLIEIGPHSALQGPIKQILKAVGGNAPKIPYASALARKKDAVESALDLAASLVIKGANLNFEAINFPKLTKVPTILTDLPRYPWNYQSKYWQESRMTQKHKYREPPRSDMIGTLANYSSDLEPTWRNIVRIDDLPWLSHHKIQSLTIFPMSGFITMALEAAAQRALSKDLEFDNFELRDVSVTKPLVIPDKDIEMTINLRPHQEGTLVTSDVWDEFRICSWTLEQGWTEHCIGLIATKPKNDNAVDGERQADESAAFVRSTRALIENAETSRIAPSDLYNSLAEAGVEYGPTFQGINSCEANESCSVGDVLVGDLAKDMPNNHMTDTIVPSTFLESLIEMYWPIVGAGRSPVDTIYLPSSVEHMTVSSRVISLLREPGNTLRAYCQGKVSKTNPKPALVDMSVTSGPDSLEALITLNGLSISPILDGETQMDTNAARELCYKLEWDPVLEPLQTIPNGISNGAPPRGEIAPNVGIVIVHEETAFQQLVALGVANALEQVTGRLPEVGSLQEVDATGRLAVFLPELHQPFLSTLSPEQFTSLQKMLTSAEGVLWVVRGAYSKSSNPEANMVTGLSRSIRSETALKFATLDLDAECPLSESDTTDAIVKVLTAVFGADSTTKELEFVERAGSFLTPRIVHDPEMNEFVHKRTNPAVLEPSGFAEDDRLLKMEITTPGALGTLHFVDDDSTEIPLETGEIEIEVKAIGLNYKDAMAAKGHIQISDCGVEASGIITAVGNGVSSLQVGDRVAALTKGAFATRTRTSADTAFKIPADVSFQAAASLPLAYCTAYYSLVELGRISEGETVLIHAASGSVGQAAICVAQMIGAEVYATVGSPEKKELLVSEYGLSPDRIFYSRSTAFASGILKATDGQGVDLILNSLSGDALRASWECLSKFGRFLEIGKREQATKTRVEMAHTDNNASLISVDLLAVAAGRPKVMKRLVSDVGRLVSYGKVRPITPITSFPISDVEAAFKTLQIGNQGKVVVSPSPNDVVIATPSKKVKDLLRRDATYVLIGGTGGLGRSMARWMVKKGARSIVLVSRSGSVTGRVKELVDELAMTGANIVVRQCNVVNKADVEDLVANGFQDLPPVRGVVHGTMVLRVSPTQPPTLALILGC